MKTKRKKLKWKYCYTKTLEKMVVGKIKTEIFKN